MLYRYSRWDGSQQIDPFTADEVMDHIAGELLDDGDLHSALRHLLQRGAEFASGRRMLGLQELLERLRAAREQRLSQPNLGSMLDDIKERLDRAVETDRHGIQRRMEEGLTPPVSGLDAQDQPSDQRPKSEDCRPDTTDLRKLLEQIARKRLEQLDQLPLDVGGRIRELREYDFLDQEARRQFDEVLELLQRQIAQSYFQGLQHSIQSMTPDILRQLKEMMGDLNCLMQQRLRGEPTEFDFQEFMKRWGQFFPHNIKDIDQLAEHMQRQIAKMESLLNSMTPEMRRELEGMLDALFQDGKLQWELAQLAANLERLHPGGARAGAHPVSGDEPVTLEEALRLMGDLHGMDELERGLLEAIRSNDASRVDADELGRLVGQEARHMLDQLQQLTRILEEAGLLQQGNNDWELSPRAVRRIGQRALQDVFARLKLNTFGEHDLDHGGGIGVERLEETKRYTFGDPFLIDTQRSVHNALLRDGPGLPVRLRPDDFEVYRTSTLTQCATVIMLDMSYSMLFGGKFNAGRRMALALDSLIRTQFPKDTLYMAAFSYFVLPLKPEMLLDNYWIEYGRGTNVQEALRQGRLMLAKHKTGSKQIVLITDGEPTTYSHWSGNSDDHWGRYRASSGVLEETLREVARCARQDIKLNVFMLDRDPGLLQFVRTMARLNRGRAFFSTPDRLGEYVLFDYLDNRRRVAQ